LPTIARSAEPSSGKTPENDEGGLGERSPTSTRGRVVRISFSRFVSDEPFRSSSQTSGGAPDDHRVELKVDGDASFAALTRRKAGDKA
jgi:hypothetical protein